MSSSVARDLFTSRTFCCQLEDQAAKRIGDIITVTGALSDMVYSHEKKVGKDSLLDRIFKIMGVKNMGNCNFCLFDAIHDCVN